MNIRNLKTLLIDTAVNLNIFPLRDFGSHVDRLTAKRLGQWTTRLYISLLIMGLTILALYTIVRPESQTKTFDNLSLDTYNRLTEKYGNELACPCSSIVATYTSFVAIESVFHKVRRNQSDAL
jgi:hypothetical protein